MALESTTSLPTTEHVKLHNSMSNHSNHHINIPWQRGLNVQLKRWHGMAWIFFLTPRQVPG